MSIIEDEFDKAFQDPVKRKTNKTQNLRKASKFLSGVPEVMVKITGFGKGAAHVRAHLAYITRHGDVELENDRGEVFQGKAEIKALFTDWAGDFADVKRRPNQRDTMHLVLSMPENVDPVSVHEAVREFNKKTFGKNHEYVFALHTDAPHPHCHVTVKCLGFNGRRLNPRKADLQTWRDRFADAMQLQGVEANATPRRARGVVKKAERSVIRHIEQGDEKRPPRVSRVRALAVKEIAQEITEGLAPNRSGRATVENPAAPERPWEQRIRDRQEAVRTAWLAAATALEQPRPRIEFKKEPNDGRPNYDQLDAATTRRIQRSAGVYQSRLEDARGVESAPPIAGLRNLSSLPLVQSQRSAEVLLHTDARADLGYHDRRATDSGDGVRRTGAGVDGPGHGRGAGGPVAASAATGVMAQRIREFVGELPAPETARDTMRKRLLAQFRQAPVVEAAPAADVKPNHPDRGVDR